AKLTGKPGVTLGLELLKDDSKQVTNVEYFANGKLIKSGTGAAELSWTPPGSGAFQLSARVTMADGSKSTSSATPVIITGVGTTPLKGSYTGAVSDNSTQKAAAGTGTVQISTTSSGAKGSYSMRLVLNGTALVAAGKFDAESVATPSVTVRTGETPKTYRVRFQQEATGFSDTISGVVTDGSLSASGEPSGGSFASSFVASRNVWSASNTAGTLAGKYTMTLPLMDDSKDAALGTSLVTLSPLGLVSGKFFLNDGSRITTSGVVSKDGIWQPYVSLYSKQGFLTGSVDFSDKGQTGWVSGDLYWRQDAAKLSNLDALGGVYVAPAKGSVFAVKGAKSNITIAIAEGGLKEAIKETATLTSTNVIQVPTPNTRHLVFRLDRATGALSGSFTAPGDTTATPVTGVVFQTQKKAVGYFTRNGHTGTIEITANP
ncbi:MAG: hypothetical protein WCK17_01400, partial [Verrucomicrobiota bacterium]